MWGEGGGLCANAKSTLLKVESKLVIRCRTLSFTNQGDSKNPIGVKKCSPFKQYIRQWGDGGHCHLKYLHCMR